MLIFGRCLVPSRLAYVLITKGLHQWLQKNSKGKRGTRILDIGIILFPRIRIEICFRNSYTVRLLHKDPGQNDHLGIFSKNNRGPSYIDWTSAGARIAAQIKHENESGSMNRGEYFEKKRRIKKCLNIPTHETYQNPSISH